VEQFLQVGKFRTYDFIIELQDKSNYTELYHTASRLDLRLHYIFDFGCKLQCTHVLQTHQIIQAGYFQHNVESTLPE